MPFWPSPPPSYWYAKLGRICKTRRKQSNNNNRKGIFFTSLRNNKLSLWHNIYTQRIRNDFAFKWCQIARDWLDIHEVIGCWTWNWQYFFVKYQVWWQKISNSPHLISTSISVCNAQSFADHLSKSHNLKAFPFRAIKILNGTTIVKWIWLTAVEKKMDMLNSEYRIAERGVGT